MVKKGVREFETTEGITVLVPEPDGFTGHEADFEICIRPERINIERQAVEAVTLSENVSRITGTIRDVAHLGADIHLIIEIVGGHQLTVTEQYLGQTLEQAGEEVTITFRPEDCIVVPAQS